MHYTPDQHKELLKSRLEEAFPDLRISTGLEDYENKVWCKIKDPESGRVVYGPEEFVVDDQEPQERAQSVISQIRDLLE